MTKTKSAERKEQDLLGIRKVPTDAYYGIQTLRAKENFDITGITVGSFPNLVKALAMVKKACARANLKLNLLNDKRGQAICGGSTFFTFPVFLAAGIPPVVANASNAIAVWPGHAMAVLDQRKQIK